MKTLKRAVGVILAVITLAMCLSINVFAEGDPAGTPDSSLTGTITVINEKSRTNVTISGRKYYAYRVFDLDLDDSRNAHIYTLNSDFKGLFRNGAFKEAFKDSNDLSALANEVDESSTSTIYKFVSSLTKTKDIQKFANIVYKYAADKKIPPMEAEGTEDEKAIFEDIPLGYYLIYGESVPVPSPDDNAKVITACALGSIEWDKTKTAYTAVVYVKADVPGVEKKIVKENNDLVDVDSAGIGDTINFRVTSNVPELVGYEEGKYTFKMVDTMSSGLTFVESEGVTVKIGDDTIDNENSVNYTVAWDNDTSTLTVSFTDFYTLVTEKHYAAGTEIVYEYSAMLNGNAVVSPSSNPNEVRIVYSNDPHSTTTTETVTDKVKLYTFEFDILKFTMDGDTKKVLSGAQFKIKKDDTFLRFYCTDDGEYRVATPLETAEGNTETTTKVISNSAGKIIIIGLDEGEYTLSEVKAPSGYNKMKSDITFKIEPEYAPVTNELIGLKTPAEGASYTLLDNFAGAATEIENTPGILLLQTGGAGTLVIYIAGILFMLIALFGFTARLAAKKQK